MMIDTNGAEPHLSILDEGALNGNTNNNPGSKQLEHNDDDDIIDVDGPRVDTHVDLSRIACKYILHHTQYCGNIPIYMTVCKMYPKDIEIEQPHFSDLIQKFIYNQQHLDDCSNSSSDSESALPTFYGMVTIYPSAIAMFHAPSYLSEIGGMCCERICAVKSWRKGPSCYNTIFVETDPSEEGMRGLDIVHVHLFFHFLMMALNIPVLLCIDCHMWEIYQTSTQACG